MVVVDKGAEASDLFHYWFCQHFWCYGCGLYGDACLVTDASLTVKDRSHGYCKPGLYTDPFIANGSMPWLPGDFRLSCAIFIAPGLTLKEGLSILCGYTDLEICT